MTFFPAISDPIVTRHGPENAVFRGLSRQRIIRFYRTESSASINCIYRVAELGLPRFSCCRSECDRNEDENHLPVEPDLEATDFASVSLDQTTK
jgi:hypothetical protein